MKGFLRRLRGIIGTGITWAVGWAGGYSVVSVVIGAPLSGLGAVALAGAIFGFIAGGSFAVILSITERRRAFDQLSLWRVAVWGGLGGMALPLFFAPRLIGAGFPLHLLLTTYLIPLAVSGLMGAGFATGSVALARRADTKLIEGEDDSTLMLEGD